MMANLLTPLVIICMAFLFASVLILSAGFNPVAAFYHLFAGAFGTKASLINTINKAITVMKSAGIPATAKKIDEDSYIEYVIKIPKRKKVV